MAELAYMKGNPRAGQLGHAHPHRLTAVSGAHPIEPVVPIEVEDCWLEFDDMPRERALREQQQELERIRLDAEARIALVEAERDAAVAMLAEVRLELAAFRAATALPPEAEAPRVAPIPLSPVLSGEPRGVPTLSEVLVATDPLADEFAAVGADNRRTEPRIQRQFELEFNYETQFFAGLSLDISSGGLFIATYHLLPRGTALALSFQLPDGVRLSVRGEVRWVRCASEGHERPGMGVAFKELSLEALAAITRFCAERPPLYIDL